MKLRNPFRRREPAPTQARVVELGPRRINARFDAAQDSPDFRNYWSAADSLDADSAHSREVRERLVRRSRYEVGNNGYTDGMVQTHANYLVGTGPKLRMLTASTGFNRVVEAAWERWCKAVKLRRKLWCMAHARVQDGEAFGLLRNNPGVRNDIKLDLQLIETEQCQTPYISAGTVGKIDGIQFDDYGNPVSYDILPQHPGGQLAFLSLQKPINVPAQFMVHWFMLRRPGQHRAVPEFRSTLNDGAQGRRWREATVAAAETAADYSAILHTQLTPDTQNASVNPFTEVPIDKRTMVALPHGWEMSQLKSEHPNTTFGEFNRSLISQQGRPKSMPYNIAACDSSDYNFSSGKLDHQTYFLLLDCERGDGDDLVLDPIFELWFAEASEFYGWVTGPYPMPPHGWDWPNHPIADVKTESAARDQDLRNGSISLSEIYASSGRDFADDLPRMAEDYGVTEDEMRAILRETIFKQTAPQAPPAASPDQQPTDQNDSSNQQAA